MKSIKLSDYVISDKMSNHEKFSHRIKHADVYHFFQYFLYRAGISLKNTVFDEGFENEFNAKNLIIMKIPRHDGIQFVVSKDGIDVYKEFTPYQYPEIEPNHWFCRFKN